MLQPIRDISPNTPVSSPENNPINIDAEIKESVSKLESDISKTIENNNKKLKEVAAEIEQLLHAKNAHISPLVESVVHDDERIEIASNKPIAGVDYLGVDDVAKNGDDIEIGAVEANGDDAIEPTLPTTTILSITDVPVEPFTMSLANIATETVTLTTMAIMPTTVRPDMDTTVANRLPTTTAKVSFPLLHLHII